MISPNHSHAEEMTHRLSVEFFGEHLSDQTPNIPHSYCQQNSNRPHPYYQQIPQ
jgi:hypothetical protein